MPLWNLKTFTETMSKSGDVVGTDGSWISRLLDKNKQLVPTIGFVRYVCSSHK